MNPYLAYSTDDDIRYLASSGGFCKEIIRFLLEQKIYNKVILTELGDGKSSLIPQTVITDDIDKVLSPKSNSIYNNTHPLSVLDELREDESYIFVGLPCHIKTVKEFSIKKNIKIFTICLFCNHTPDYNYTKYILEKHDVNENDVTHFEYRGSGWAGKTKIKTKNEEFNIDFIPLWVEYDYKTPLKKCRNCVDFISYDADICVGDAWIQRIMKKDDLGTNIVIAMSKIGDVLINKSHEDGYIVLENWGEEEFSDHMKSALNEKIKRKNKWSK